MSVYAAMRYPIRVIPLLVILTAACGGSSPTSPEPSAPTAPTPQTTAVTYSGTFQLAAGGYGAVSLTANVPLATLAATSADFRPMATATATGTVRPGGSAQALPITGTYDTVTKKFEMTGSGFTVSATVSTTADGDTVNGSVSNGQSQGAVVAVPAPATGAPPTTFCGGYTGDTRGTLVMVRKDNKLFALVAEQGAPADFSIVGTITGTDVFFKFDYAPPDVGSTTVIGTIDGGTISGTWTASYIEPGRGQVNERGDWLVRAGNCPA